MDAGLKRSIGGCLGKCAYSSEALAQEVRRRREKATGKHLRVYRCDLAPHWHLAHVPLQGFAKVQELCAVCLDPFEPTGPDDWAHAGCKPQPTGGHEAGEESPEGQ